MEKTPLIVRKMPTTILQYLTRPNSKVYSYGASGSLTFSQDWAEIEGVRAWEDFNYATLSARFSSELKQAISPWDPFDLIRRSRFNETVNEDSVTALLTVNCMLLVNNALFEVDSLVHFGTGSKFFKPSGSGSPDWGCGRAYPEINDRANFCPGDIKCSSKWTSDGLLDANWDMYPNEDDDLAIKARPLEQVQQYCINLGTRYGWIMTERELVVIRVTNSTDDDSISPRQTRSGEVGVGGSVHNVHRRIISNSSNLSSAFSAMSIDHSVYSGRTGSSSGNNPAPLEIVCVPMSRDAKDKGHLTVNLALFFLALLAKESCAISSSYPPLDRKASKTSKHMVSKLSSKSSKPLSKPQNPHRSHTSETSSTISQFFVPAEGIQWEVIKADIDFYLPKASVYKAVKNEVEGFLISTQAKREALPDVLSSLRANTAQWAQEGGLYTHSESYLNRHRPAEGEGGYGQDKKNYDDYYTDDTSRK